MKPTVNQIAVWCTLALTALATLMRLLTLPLVQAEAVGETGISIWLLAALIVAAAVLAVFSFRSRLPLRAVEGAKAKPLGIAAAVAGGVLFIDTVMSMLRLSLTGITPPPNAQLLNTADRATLWLTLVFGFLGGLWLVMLGVRWLRQSPLTTIERFGALLPILWIWCRLARYELSYASATNVKRSFYDFFMLIFLTLFLLALARYAADVCPPSAKAMRAYASITAMVGLSSPLTRLGMHLLGDTESFNASRLAGITDFAIGLLALALTWYFYHEETIPDEDEADEGILVIETPEEESATPITDQLLSEWMPQEKP